MADSEAAHLEMEDKAAQGSRQGGRGGGRRGGGGKPQDRNVLVSKALSKLLRHQAGNAGVKLDEGGWAELDKVLAYGPIRSLRTTLDDITTVIATSDKTRFALKPNPATNLAEDTASKDPAHWLIRANQGHSIKLESAALLSPITLEAGNLPPLAVHGTYFATWPLIEACGGLKRMNRNHVHFAAALPEEIDREVSGMRKDAEVLVYVDLERALTDGMLWWRSENGVILTEGDVEGMVSSRYFKEVVGRVKGVGTLWRDGEKVGEIPERVKGVVPPNARRGGGGRGRGHGRA